MREVTGPIVATALVLCAVFVPTAFITGLTGQFYRQFALTIAISTVISAFNSLTLSPALAAVLLQPHGAPKDRFERAIDGAFGWLFRPFNRVFARASQRLRRRRGAACCGAVGIALVVYGVLLALTAVRVRRARPTGFVPQQDKLYLVAVAQLPDARHARSHRGGDPQDERHRAEDAGRRRTPWPSPACRSTASSTAPTPASCS